MFFCWRSSLTDALSSYVKRTFINKVEQTVTSQWRYTVFPIVFPVELGCFHLFYPITKLLKIFARNSHMLLRIDYISTCGIHFKCTLLLEDIISWHVGGRFFMAHSVVNKELKAINSAPLWRKLNQKLLISICHKNQPKYSTVFTCVQRCSCSNLLRISRLILACLLSTIICQQTPSSLSFTPVALVISTEASSWINQSN